MIAYLGRPFALVVLSIAALCANAADIMPFSRTLPPVSDPGYALSINGEHVTLAEIEQLPLYKSRFETRWKASGEFVGIRFRDLLKAHGIKHFRRILLAASNDYKASLTPDEAGLDSALLATRLNGKPLPLDDKGPFWLIFPANAESTRDQTSYGELWVWSLVRITQVR